MIEVLLIIRAMFEKLHTKWVKPGKPNCNERSAVHDQLIDKFIYTLLIIRSGHRFVLFFVLIKLVNRKRCGITRTAHPADSLHNSLDSISTSWLFMGS